MTTRISLITWNSLFQAPSDALIDDIVQALGEDGTPDIVVIAMQEAPIGDGEQLDEKLMQNVPLQEKYLQAVDPAWIGGITKQKTLTRMSIFKASNPAQPNKFGETTFTIGRVGAGGKLLKGTKGNVFGWKTKGGIYSIVDHISDNSGPGAKGKMDSRRIAFIGAHLASKNEQSRAIQIEGLLTNLIYQDFRQQRFPLKSNAGPLPKDVINERLRLDFDAVFFMGDLNYRLQFGQNITIPGDEALMPSNISIDDIADLIDNPKHRTSLVTHLDSLDKSSLKTDFNFNFNSCLDTTGHAFLPTYKINYRANDVNSLPNRIVTNETGSRQACETLYALDSVVNEKRKRYDLGWVDRIGWVDRSLNRPDSGKNVVTLVSQRVFYRPISDHFPVMMTVELR